MYTGRNFFISKEEAEPWITPASRSFQLPDGSVRTVAAFQSTWESLDFILATGIFTEKRVIELGIDQARYSGKRFEEEFGDLINYIEGQIRKAMGIIDADSGPT